MMDIFIRVAVVVAATGYVSAVSDDCFNIPCELNGGVCFSSGCKRVGLQTICQLTSTSHKAPPIKPGECVAPWMVPGFADFCTNVLMEANKDFAPGPVNIQNGDKTTTRAPTKDEKILELSPDETCFGTTILVSIAVGSFVGGCAVTLVLLCCCRVVRPCMRKNKIDESFDSDTRDVWHTRQRSREQGSTSTAQLLPGASTDNGASYPNVSSSMDGPHQGSGVWSRDTSLPGFTSRSYMLDGTPRFEPTLPVMETIYAPGSESSRDYQSIQGGSENPYTVQSESGSDYFVSTRQGDHVGADYMSLRGGNGVRREDGSVYYPNSDESGKDYTSLAGERDDYGYTDVFDDISKFGLRGPTAVSSSTAIAENVKFHVNGLEFPNKQFCNNKRAGQLENIEEYDTMEGESFGSRNLVTNTHGPRGSQTSTNTLNGSMLEAGARGSNNADNFDGPHEYFVLEPMDG